MLKLVKKINFVFLSYQNLKHDIMIKLIEQTKTHTIAFEIIGSYTRDDEHSLEKLFEQRLDLGMSKVNMLVKISELHIMKSSFKAIWQDGIYALKHLKYCGRIAVVGDSKMEDLNTDD